MPTIGEEKRSCDVGFAGEAWLRWSACPLCDKERWVRVKDATQLCVSCAAKTRARNDRPITYNGVGTPETGDTTKANLIGLTGDQIMFYDPCVKCGQPHWVRKQGKGTHCSRCAPKYQGPRRDRTRDGRYQEKSGYVHVRLEKNDPLWGMAGDGGWVLEHRIAVARRVGRILAKNEVVHHINGIRWDNRANNLKLLTKSTHHCYLVTYDHQNRIQSLEQRVTLLEAENAALHKQLASIANPEPSRESNLLGVCRDLTGDTLQYEGEEKVHSSGKPESECGKCSDRGSCFRRNRQPRGDGASVRQLTDKLRVKRGNLQASGSDAYGNPVPSLPKSYYSRQEGVETRDEDSSTNKSRQIPPSQVDEEIVHTSRKLLASSGNLLDITSQISSQEPIRAALEENIKWRWVNTPNSGNAKLGDKQANPELAEDESPRASVETIQGAFSDKGVGE